jgi:hypothetical protein
VGLPPEINTRGLRWQMARAQELDTILGTMVRPCLEMKWDKIKDSKV